MTATEPRIGESPPVPTPEGPQCDRLAASRGAHGTTRVSPPLASRLPELELAVVGNQAVWFGGARVLERAPRDLAELGELSERFGTTQFWFHESALESLGFPRNMRANAPGGSVPHSFFDAAGAWESSRRGLAPWSYWWLRGGRGFHVHVPAYNAESPFAGVRTAVELLEHVARYEHATRGAAPWRGAGSITSDGYLRQRLRGKVAPTACPPPVEEHWAQELAYLWHRPPAPTDRRYRYCHALDLNLAYAAAASSLELPTGECVHEELPPAFDARTPGVYLFDVTERWSLITPPPWGQIENGYPPAAHWVTAPTAERMVQLGYWPIEAWTWPSHARYLRPWYELLRDAREELLEGGGPALAAVKQVCRMGLGRLASERRTLPQGAEYLEDDPTFQPYWSWAVVAETRCRLQRRLSALESFPVAVDTDALYFLSSRADPERLGAALGLPVGTGLGRFKSHGTCRANDALEALSEPESSRAVARLRELVA